MIKRFTAYRATDGSFFETKKEADRYEATCNLRRLLMEMPVGDSDDRGAFEDEVYQWLLHEGWRVVNVLSDVLRRGGIAKPTD